jgi:hypothetical protein
MQSREALDLVDQQKEGGTAAGVSHTPFFVMDGVAVPDDDYGDLKSVFAAALP